MVPPVGSISKVPAAPTLALRRLGLFTSRLWPLPALLAWAAGWSVFASLRSLGAPALVTVATAVALGALLSVIGTTPWRRVFIATGFPLSLAASGLAGALPAWGWLLPLALLALAYPLNAWRDAPLFPTPTGALQGLAAFVPLAPGARILDAGCGLGAGLRELRRAYPEAVLHGLECSWLLRIACGWRCRFARVQRGDMWAADWSACDMVYVFQRPESMNRAAKKASLELRQGAWLASLEFEARGFAANRVVECADGRRLWLYRAPLRTVSAKCP